MLDAHCLCLIAVWRDQGFLPEEFDYLAWQVPPPSNGGMGSHQSAIYALRPELIESTFLMYQATKDDSWVEAGVHFMEVSGFFDINVVMTDQSIRCLTSA